MIIMAKNAGPPAGARRHCSPPDVKSSVIFPSRDVGTTRSSTVRPKPRRAGASSGHGQVSIHASWKRAASDVARMFQKTATFPPSRDSAPYFSAFVTSSCIARPSVCVASGEIMIEGPSTVTVALSVRSRMAICSWTRSFSETPPQLAPTRRSCERESPCSLSRNECSKV